MSGVIDGQEPADERGPADGRVPALPVRAFLWVYKGLLSPALHALSPSQCLYLPTCSEYAYIATARFGVFRGGMMALRRLARCHPFAKGGLDPVPPAPAEANRLP